MKNITTTYFKPKQGILPIFISDFLDICHPVNMLKTVLFGFMSQGYISLRELEDNCKVN